MMKVIVDAYGGDNAPKEIVIGALKALSEREGFSIILTGDKGKLTALIDELSDQVPEDRLEIFDAPDVITCDMPPVEAVRKMRNSSLVKGLNLLNTDPDAKAFVSAGSTGAVLTAATLLVKRKPGIVRAGLAPVLPTVKGGRVILIDCGANSECKPEMLLNFAELGADMAKKYLGIPEPKIGLLSNGTEDTKGTDLTREAFKLIKGTELNFVGNIEAREILSGDIDVVVSDGFSGNIALKACEGTALAFMTLLKDGIMGGGIRAKIGYLLLKPVLKQIKKTMDYNAYGGAVFAGLEKTVIKAHGSSKAKSIAAAVLQAVDLNAEG
ncbi:MAG TPA: phosphate acyltransferase PlsX [Candidatus Stercoripulliclostridium merdigallinarum]|uniref:Phosphate acyltransferase n=1 Tax=Candidatus Stercoripulliclostridium merdigallinarum TaxID=2840951 RepID=A0A9D1MHK4_9FIRM|nr:phosphate acyltransferase PlsX [Candidatus Stercoripulliclostridium merdigallinarum]